MTPGELKELERIIRIRYQMEDIKKAAKGINELLRQPIVKTVSFVWKNLKDSALNVLGKVYEKTILVHIKGNKAIKNIGNEIDSILSGIGKGAFNVLEPKLKQIENWFKNNKPLIEKWVELGSKVFAGLANTLLTIGAVAGNVFANIADVVSRVTKFFREHEEQIKIIAAVLATILSPAIFVATVNLVALTAALIANKIASIAETVALMAMYAWDTAVTIATLLFNTALLANPVTWIVIGIIALIGALVLLIKNWDKVKLAVLSVINKIKAVIKAALDWLVENWKTIVTVILLLTGPIGWIILALVKTIRENWNTIKDTAIAVWTAVMAFFTMIWEGIRSAAEFCWNGILNVITAISSAVQGAWQAVVNWFVEKFQMIKQTMTDVLNNPLFKTISKGIKSTIDIGTSAIKNVRDSVFGKPDGKHATGLSYVPFDGYIAQLHKGERVLTASENKAFSNTSTSDVSTGARASGGNIFNISINSVGKSTDEIVNEMVRKIKEVSQNMGRAVTV